MRALYLFSLLLPHLTGKPPPQSHLAAEIKIPTYRNVCRSSLAARVAAGQFQEPWIELAADSVAYTNFSDVTADAASATIAEDIPINTVVFLINRLGELRSVKTAQHWTQSFRSALRIGASSHHVQPVQLGVRRTLQQC